MVGMMICDGGLGVAKGPGMKVGGRGAVVNIIGDAMGVRDAK